MEKNDVHKKDHERKILEGFSILEEIPMDFVEAGERPDFIAEIDGRRVGIELTRIVKPELGTIELRRKKTMDRIVAQLQKACEDRFPKIDVGLEFNREVGKVSRDKVCSLVLDVIESHWPDVQKFRDYYEEELDLFDGLPGPLSKMNLKHYLAPTRVYVRRDSWGAGPLDREVFLDKVRHKRELARSYAYDAEELWLIVYNEWGAHADYYLFPHESYYRPMEMDPFDIVVLYSVKDNLIYEFPALN